MRNKRWLIIADSLALPRQDVPYDATWPYLLQKYFPDVDWIVLARRASTTDRLHTDGDKGADCLEFYQPDGVILQLGVCDCAPRLFRRGSIVSQIVFRLPFGLNRWISTGVERIFGRSVKNAWVGVDKYSENLTRYLERCRRYNVRVLALAVFPVGKRVISKNPVICEQIAEYNQVLIRLAEVFENFHLISMWDDTVPVDDYYVDGYHLNRLGAELVANRITCSINNVAC